MAGAFLLIERGIDVSVLSRGHSRRRDRTGGEHRPQLRRWPCRKIIWRIRESGRPNSAPRNRGAS